MKTLKFKIKDLKGKTLQVNCGCRAEFYHIDSVKLNEGDGFDITSGKDILNLTDDEFFDLIFDGEVKVKRQGIYLYHLIINEQ